MPRITVLSCPVCAAPLRLDSSRCAYCGSVVVIQTDHPRLDPHLLNRGVIDEHIAKFRTSVRRDPNDETAHYGLGIAYFNLGLLEEAADELTQAARLMPENPHIQTQLAVVYADLAKKGAAGAERSAWDRLNRALLLRPNLVEALLLKADLHLRARVWRKAVEAWRDAAGVEPDAVRAPIARFLEAHKDVMLQMWPTRVARRHEAQRTKRQFMHFAIAAFLVCCVLTSVISAIGSSPETGTESSDPVSTLVVVAMLGMIIIPIAIFQYGKRKHREGLAEASSVTNLSPDERAFLTGKVPDAIQLVEVANDVASVLHRRDEETVERERLLQANAELAARQQGKRR